MKRTSGTMVNMNKRKEQGFTLIELSMSLVFIAFIMLFLTSTMLNIMQTYNKGIWLNQINQAGRQINSDIGDQIRFSKNKIIIDDGAQRFCIGGVVYLWNTDSSVKNWYSDEETTPGVKPGETKLRFARVLDGTGKYCKPNSSNKFDMPVRSNSNTTAMLGPGSIVQQFKVTESSETGLLRVRVVFSTEGDDQPKPIKTDGQVDTANPPASTSRWQCGEVVGGVFKVGNNNFCAFAEFDIITYRRIKE